VTAQQRLLRAWPPAGAHGPGMPGQPSGVGERAAQQELDLGVGAAQLGPDRRHRPLIAGGAAVFRHRLRLGAGHGRPADRGRCARRSRVQDFRPTQRRSTHSAAPHDWARARRGSPHAHFGATARAAASGGSSSEPTVTTRRTVPSGKASHSLCTPGGPGGPEAPGGPGGGGWSRSVAPAASGGAVPAGTPLVADAPGVVPSAFMTATFAGLVTFNADTSTYHEVRAPGPALIAPLLHCTMGRPAPASVRDERRCAGDSAPRRETPGQGTGPG
jgi:hypothetical protein